jgi:hypothetical protein
MYECARRARAIAKVARGSHGEGRDGHLLLVDSRSAHLGIAPPCLVSSRSVFPHSLRSWVSLSLCPPNGCGCSPPETQAIGGVKIYMPPAADCVRPEHNNTDLPGPFNSDIKCDKVSVPEHLLSNRRSRNLYFGATVSSAAPANTTDPTSRGVRSGRF